MKNLFIQILKYSLTGVITAIIDFAVFSLLSMYHIHYIASNIASYFCSMIANYWLSVNFVFDHKDGWSRKKEFAVFVCLSLIGLLINTFFLWFFYDVIYLYLLGNDAVNSVQAGKMLCKAGATSILLVYSFLSKKLFLKGQKREKELAAE